MYFYPRSPCGERLPINDSITLQDIISIHALLAESDHRTYHQCPKDYKFLSTLSLRRATEKVPADVFYSAFLSTLSLRRATNVRPDTRQHDAISIHALLAESDRFQAADISARRISIHALLAESDITGLGVGLYLVTISIHALLAESDPAPSRRKTTDMNFYPRSPCGERHTNLRRHSSNDDFYPRSPCGERRRYSFRHPASCWHFYPRSPCGERPTSHDQATNTHRISIHALLAESDVQANA